MRESQYRREVVCRWFWKAQNDLKVAELLLREEFPGEAAFHAQQAVEKALKAVLTALGERPPKTHRVELLLELIARSGVDVEGLQALGLESLSNYAIEARYPDLGEEPTREEAEEALRIAREAVEWVRERLGEMGIEC